MGEGLPCLGPGYSLFLWTGVLTLAPPTVFPNRNPSPHAGRLLPGASPRSPRSPALPGIGVGRELQGASGMSLFNASTSVPTSAEASGADEGSPDLVWSGGLGSHEPRGRAGLPASSQVGDTLHWAALHCRPALSAYHPSRSGGAGSLATVPPITLFPLAAHIRSASRFPLEPCWGWSEMVLSVGDSY